MKSKVFKFVFPASAFALAILASFAFTANSSAEEVANVGSYAGPSGPCTISYDCGQIGGTNCTETDTGFGLPVLSNTDCSTQLKRLP